MMEQVWIPCGERLPEWGESVIVGWVDDPDMPPREGFLDEPTDSRWVDAGGLWYYRVPTHWQQMPPPPVR